MGKKGKINDFIQALEQLMFDGAPGFVSELPGQRELAERFRLSQSSVHIALAELEQRGLVRNVPCKGTFVTLDRSRASRSGWTLNLAVCEDMPHQRSFWQDAAGKFEAAHPGAEVKIRFYSCRTELEKTVSGDSNYIVIRPGNYRDAALPLVPLRELLPEATIRSLKEQFFSGIPAPDWSVALPYQLQVPALIYRTAAVPPENDVMQFLDWAAASFGTRSLPVPDLNFLRDRCGLDRAEMLCMQASGISPELKTFFRILEKMAALKLINPDSLQPEEQLRHLKSGQIQCAELFSHLWSEGGAESLSGLHFAPPPHSGKPGVNFFLSTAIQTGHRSASDAEKAFFRFLASSAFLSDMQRRGLGIAPYTNILDSYHPAASEPDFSRVARWAARMHFTDTSMQLLDQVWYSVLRKLRIPVILPLLFGKLSADEAEQLIFECRLLAESELEDALAERILRFDLA